jgi:transcriptional regulator with XRE-family HTH domain
MRREMIDGYPRTKLSVVPSAGQALVERKEYAAKIRAARALLGWSQAELGQRVGVTQRSINRLENADVDVRRSTAVAIDAALKAEGVWFEELSSGGYRIVVQRRARANKPS